MKEEANLFIRMTDSSRFSKTFLNSEMTEEKTVLLLSPVPWILPLLHYSSFSLQNIQVLPLRQIYSWASKGTQNSLPYSKTFLFQLSLFTTELLKNSYLCPLCHCLASQLTPNWFLLLALEAMEDFYGLQIQWRVLGSI